MGLGDYEIWWIQIFSGLTIKWMKGRRGR
jgi:hypothetical protein